MLGDAIGEGIAYSLWEIIGYPLIYLMLITVLFAAFKYLASNKLARWKELLIFYLLGLVPLGLFVGLILIDKNFGTPVIEFSSTGNMIAAVISILTFAVLALWGKTWIWIIIPTILFLPDLILKSVELDEQIKLFLNGFIPLIGLFVYFLIMVKVEKRKKST